MPDEKIVFQKLGLQQEDTEWMEWQQYVAMKICTIFGISEQELGVAGQVIESSVVYPVEDETRLIG